MNIYNPYVVKNSERDLVNYTVKSMIPEIESKGVLSPKVIKIFNNAILYSMRNSENTYDVFESILVWLENSALKEIKFKVQRISTIVLSEYSESKCKLNEILADVQFMNKEYSILFNEYELNAFSTSIYLRVNGESKQADNIVSVIINGMVNRVYLDYFKSQFGKNISSFVASNSHNNVKQENNYHPAIKRGPRNKHHSEVIRIVNLTLEQYPNVSTYSLSNKLSVHLSMHRDAPSIQTLRRWVQDVRDDQTQIPQEPYTKRFKLICD